MSTEKTPSGGRNKAEQAALDLKQTRDLENYSQKVIHALIEEQVLHGLGQPQQLLTVQVRPLWGGNYRVNVFVGSSTSSAEVAHSYFIGADADGNIKTCSPAIARHY